MKGTYSFKMRVTAVIAVILFIVSFFIADLFRIQVIMGKKYASKNLFLSSANTQIEALRGEILDANGNALVYNVSSNSVYIDASYFPKVAQKAERNEIMLSLINLFDENFVEYESLTPLEMVNGKISYKADSEAVKKFVFKKDFLNLNSYASAENCFDALVEFYGMEDMSQEDALRVSAVYIAMNKASFSTNNPFTIAENVPLSMATYIKEQSRFYKGVEVRVDTERAYYDGTIAPHIVGFYDSISAEEYEAVTAEYQAAIEAGNLSEEELQELKLRAYGMTDKIGKFGIESAMEDELRGTNGILTTTTNSDGTKTTFITTAPVNGNNVILTIDGGFQKDVQDILSTKIDSTKETDAVATAGSIVVMDVNDFSVLACATYPSYDLSTYKDNIVELNNDKTAPLWNRALRSTYAPGSTVKPIVGIAGLEEGVITTDSTIQCNLTYTYFKDLPLNCMGLGNHGGSYMNLQMALTRSCNTYFYETGRLLGISKLNEYFTMFGLGQKTGVELTEAKGVVASKENREAAGGIWYPGNTVQAAIGQSDNLFTPIQLCAYVSTLANGGTKYQAHFVKSIKSYDYTQTYYEASPVILSQVNASPESLNAVKQGMVSMANTVAAFQYLDYSVAAKTGTAQAKKKVGDVYVEYTNGFMISFAPADNPQIAVVIAIENVTSGGLGNYVAEVYEAYFNRDSEITSSQQSGSILN